MIEVADARSTWPPPRIIAWELTRACNLRCVHCRAAATPARSDAELSTAECAGLVDEIAALATPMIILTGGEPLLRPDLFEIAGHGTRRGLRMALATNGALLTDDAAARARDAGIRRISISLDGSSPALHERIRGVRGAFEGAVNGARAARHAGVPFQINSTASRVNYADLPALADRAERLGAAAFHLFLLVPTGRGRDLREQAISAAQCEDMLVWFETERQKRRIEMRATCAPHYVRIRAQLTGRGAGEHRPRGRASGHAPPGNGSGCMAGRSFCFISHDGRLQPCGYLDLDCGSARDKGFWAAWETSEILRSLRDIGRITGKCGRCEFLSTCGGCRARAKAATGNYLGSEPLCAYQPAG